MRKFIVAAATVATLAAPTAAMAAAPDGQYVINPNQISAGHTNSIAQQSSQIEQNGQFVSSTQTQTPGERAALVQASLGH